MSYVAKTDWKHDDPVTEQDLNRWETGIKNNSEKLGGVQQFPLTSSSGSGKSVTNSNLNKTITAGLYNVLTTDTNNPTTTAGSMIVSVRGSSVVMQLLHSQNNDLYVRYSNDTGTTWVAWQKMATTDLATATKNGLMLSTDKSALDNAQKVKLTLDTDGAKSMPGSDANNINESGYYVVSVGALNVPEQYGIISHVKRSGTGNIQYFMATGTGNMYVRGGDSSGWRTWRRLTDNSIIGGVLLGNRLVDSQSANYIGKVIGSTTVNPHLMLAVGNGTGLYLPASFSFEVTTANYSDVSSINGSTYRSSANSIEKQTQHLFSFNLIEHVQRTYGMIPGLTTADKVAWLKTNISKTHLDWYGYGSNPQGNRAAIKQFSVISNSWSAYEVVHSLANVSKLSYIRVNNISDHIDANGFTHFLAYANPSDGVIDSVLHTDYVELQVELSTSLRDNMKPVWIDATLQNGWVEFQASLKPQYSLGFDSFVTLKGGIKSGSLGTASMTLPVGFRPIRTMYFIVPGDLNTKSTFRVTVQSDGQVMILHFGGTSNNEFVALDGIRFPIN